MMKQKKKHLWLKIPIIALLVLLLIFAALRCYFRLPVADYYAASQKSFMIPGTNDGFVAQGIEFDEADSRFLVTGYMKDGTASPLYLVKADARHPEKTVYLAKSDGSPYSGHAGGLSLYNGLIYVADGSELGLYVYDYKSIIEADNDASVSAIGFFPTHTSDDSFIKPSFTAVYDGYLFVGEFFRDVDYPTPDEHKLITKNGDYQQALGVFYAFDDQCECGIDPEPVAVCSLPDQAQGICFNNEKIYVSTSWGVNKSHILVYDADAVVRQDDIMILGKKLPLYAFDSAALSADKAIAPMSEELIVVGDKLYVMCESASNKYVFGKFTSAQWCYATELNFFE